ncbi:FecR domain-containing protein [Chitinophaga horti]|uniref:FecR domain-containing protein n=1 Tax=Chitinophaga horti TaxID=2920382 RepID=A0ABY6IZ05_9BACT|nr:FecR domain-containing protein [Chitinophaga horti]UYQ91142.1 FecR domain-containing protein [Chitinophaga horti]
MPTRFDILLQGYVSGSLTPAELEEFLQLVKDQDLRLPAAVEQLLETSNQPLLPPERGVEMAQAILAKARQQERSRRKVYWLAAASVMLVVGMALLLEQRPKRVITAQVKTISNTLPDQPSLVLADGTVVPLDSAGNRQISAGIRQRNGQLLYSTTAESYSAPQLNKLVTPRGGRFGLTLPDGSRVWLNSASSLSYPTAFAGEKRVVELDGQAYFEVTGNTAQPFIVKVNQLEVQVLGTRFDVMAYSDEQVINTTLLSGAVRVKNAAGERMLQPGQQAVQERDGRFIVQAADTAKAVAWKNGIFLFDNMNLETILREVARWYNVEIVYSVQPSKELYGGAISRNMGLEAVLRMLEGNGYNHLELRGNKITVLP